MIIGANNAIYLKNLFGLRSGIKKVHNTANIKQAKTVRELRRYKIYAKTPIDTRITNLQNIFFIDTKLSKRIMTTNKTQTAVPFGLPIPIVKTKFPYSPIGVYAMEGKTKA